VGWSEWTKDQRPGHNLHAPDAPGLCETSHVHTTHHLTVARTARYHVLGSERSDPRSLWIACHGYGQLAETFLASFDPVADGSRWIVAPEALSRFYLETARSGRHGDQVGASWMTREDREQEILDSIGYLDQVFESVAGAAGGGTRSLLALGFSQGGPTAARWALRGKSPIEELVLWGSLLPPDVLAEAGTESWLRCGITLVAGRNDPLVDVRAVTTQAKRLEAQGQRVRVILHDGRHEMAAGPVRDLITSLEPQA